MCLEENSKTRVESTVEGLVEGHRVGAVMGHSVAGDDTKIGEGVDDFHGK